MQTNAKSAQQSAVKIYNAVYSSVQVYECMVRGIAVMRRRADSYVNATQILKVAGVEKGRRTKILEKEILPGKHEIVQGGYGKYQGTWIPLERGQELAQRYGVAPLLLPLFDFIPTTSAANTLPSMSSQTQPTQPPSTSRPLSASSSFSGMGQTNSYGPATLGPAPIMPGSAMRLLSQGRAQGLFTPSTSTAPSRQNIYASPTPAYNPNTGYNSSSPYVPTALSPAPSTSSQQLKRTRSDMEGDSMTPRTTAPPQPVPQQSVQTNNTTENNTPRPSSSTPVLNGDDNPPPAKRSRKELAMTDSVDGQDVIPTRPGSRNSTIMEVDGPVTLETYSPRFYTKIPTQKFTDLRAPLSDSRKIAIVNLIHRSDDAAAILDLLRQYPPDNPGQMDYDILLDEQGHTALHLAASMARLHTVEALINAGSDVNRGNYNGETPLVRSCLATAAFEHHCFHTIVSHLNKSIRTLDSSRKTVLHHIVSTAGIKSRAVAARYYLDQVFYWIAHHQAGDFRSLVNLQDENGDTPLNISARVGNRSLVRALLDVGANKILPNKLGLRPGDFGVETEELSGGPRAEDLLASLRSAPSPPVQKSNEIISAMTTMIHNLSSDFSAEIKSKQDAFDVIQAHLRAATRELAEQRKQIQIWQTKCGELDKYMQRVRNLEQALHDEDRFDWTGRLTVEGLDAGPTAGIAFKWRGTNSTMVALAGSVDISFDLGEAFAEPTLPTGDSPAGLVRLRRLKMWHKRAEDLMEARLRNLRGASAEKEFQCKKIVAMCTGVGIDKVEHMLETLLTAVESESQFIDIARVSGFMQKVRNGVI
ncbi:apses-domain-containing protein [Thelephora terrestris]|uniref:Apses-domain-containing protein n=1 Tax=Thelephora terrestris TaxID=56493 RepID=A0A9P6H455_9AGAM|nr:apses-domain-containing protein [Thelephora terrestris]